MKQSFVLYFLCFFSLFSSIKLQKFNDLTTEAQQTDIGLPAFTFGLVLNSSSSTTTPSTTIRSTASSSASSSVASSTTTHTTTTTTTTSTTTTTTTTTLRTSTTTTTTTPSKASHLGNMINAVLMLLCFMFLFY
ncbi:hypothetical protein I4U23_023455 [Adineta vaga]|nr:hypothetical protein I4U23_023455 [Adineta vaga]